MLCDALEPLNARVMALHYGDDLQLAVITPQLALTNARGARIYVVNAPRKLNVVLKRRPSRDEATSLSGTGGLAKTCRTLLRHIRAQRIATHPRATIDINEALRLDRNAVHKTGVRNFRILCRRRGR